MTSSGEYVLEGQGRRRLRDALRELWSFRGTVLAFAERDVRLKYKQAVLGVAWAVLQPLTLLLIFAVTLGRVAGISGQGVPYVAFALSALVPWMFLQGAVSFGANALISDAVLLRKVYFPREIPVLGAILASGIDVVFGLALFAVLGPVLGAQLSVTWLLAPLLCIGLGILGLGLSLGLAALNVYYRDFRFVVPFALQIWLFASPVAYPISVVPEGWRVVYSALNPAAGFLDGLRRVLTLGRLPDPMLLGVSLVSTMLLVVAGYAILKRLEPSMADVV